MIPALMVIVGKSKRQVLHVLAGEGPRRWNVRRAPPTPGDGAPDDRQWDLDGARPAKGVAVSARDQGGRAGGVK